MMAKWLAYYDEENEKIRAMPYSRQEASWHGYIGVGDDKNDAVRLLQAEMRYGASLLRADADLLDKAADRGLCDG